MGTEEWKEMLFWTKAEYQKFADTIMDKPVSYYAFEMLYWCDIREGELLALTPADFDFEAGTVKISICEAANVEYLVMHIFRHTFATNCDYKGCPVKV